MKRSNNPFKMVLFICAMLLVAFGSVHGNPSNAERHMMGYSMNSPPGNQIIVSIETPTFDVIQSPTVAIPIDRGVSVPCKYLNQVASVTHTDGIVFTDAPNMECNTYYTISDINRDTAILCGHRNDIDKYPFATDLGVRHTSSSDIRNLSFCSVKLTNHLRGANTRLTDFKLTAENVTV